MCFSDRPGSGHICGGKTFGGEKEESRWRAIVNCFRVFFLYLFKVTKCIFVFDGTSSGDICGGKTFGGKKEESRWGAIVGEGVMDHPRIGGTHRLQDTNTEM